MTELNWLEVNASIQTFRRTCFASNSKFKVKSLSELPNGVWSPKYSSPSPRKRLAFKTEEEKESSRLMDWWGTWMICRGALTLRKVMVKSGSPCQDSIRSLNLIPCIKVFSQNWKRVSRKRFVWGLFILPDLGTRRPNFYEMTIGRRVRPRNDERRKLESHKHFTKAWNSELSHAPRHEL